MTSNRKIRMGMVGGGPGAFIGDVHRKAARLDGKIEIVAGAFDIDPKKSQQMGTELGVDPSRTYSDYKTMIAEELKQDAPIDFVAVTTPNNWHFPMARDFLEAGFHVMCEKPMTMTLDEAKELEAIVKKTDAIFGLMHNYTAYPMVKLARDMIKQGDLGKIRKVVARYTQGWLARPIERDGQQQAAWRTDPKQSGAGGCVGDIGTHAANLAEYMTGLKITELSADLTSFIPGRPIDDDVNCLLRFEQGAKGVLYTSQVAIGDENGLMIWIYGENKSVEWHQEHPNQLYVKSLDGPVEVWGRGNEYVAAKSPAAARASRIPAGHPEAFLEAFANNYVNFAETILSKQAGQTPDEFMLDFPQVHDGVRGMGFISTCVESSANGAVWTKFKV